MMFIKTLTLLGENGLKVPINIIRYYYTKPVTWHLWCLKATEDLFTKCMQSVGLWLEVTGPEQSGAVMTYKHNGNE